MKRDIESTQYPFFNYKIKYYLVHPSYQNILELSLYSSVSIYLCFICKNRWKYRREVIRIFVYVVIFLLLSYCRLFKKETYGVLKKFKNTLYR